MSWGSCLLEAVQAPNRKCLLPFPYRTKIPANWFSRQKWLTKTVCSQKQKMSAVLHNCTIPSLQLRKIYKQQKMIQRSLWSIPVERKLKRIMKNFRPKIYRNNSPMMIIQKISFFCLTKGFQLWAILSRGAIRAQVLMTTERWAAAMEALENFLIKLMRFPMGNRMKMTKMETPLCLNSEPCLRKEQKRRYLKVLTWMTFEEPKLLKKWST